jgi:hypothetical protein
MAPLSPPKERQLRRHLRALAKFKMLPPNVPRSLYPQGLLLSLPLPNHLLVLVSKCKWGTSSHHIRHRHASPTVLLMFDNLPA